MDIIQLRYFLKTAETMNYTKAAEALFTSRQALRHTLDTLEKELGQDLFETDHNRLSLTEYGEYLALACTGAVKAFDALEADVSRFFGQQTPLRFAWSVSLSPYALPELDRIVLQDFSAKFPHITLESLPCPADKVIDLLESGEADCGCVLQMPTARPGFTATVLRTSPVTIDSGKGSPYYGCPEITLADLPGIPLIGMGELDRIARPLWEDCRRLGLTLNYRSVPNTIDALYLMRHGEVSGLNTLSPTPAPNTAPGAPTGRIPTILRGYTWELVLLCTQASPNYYAAQLLASHIANHYRTLFDGSRAASRKQEPSL